MVGTVDQNIFNKCRIKYIRIVVVALTDDPDFISRKFLLLHNNDTSSDKFKILKEKTKDTFLF